MMLEEDPDERKLQISIDSDISTIFPRLPCEDCVCYAVCRPKVIDEWNHGFVNTMDDPTKSIGIIQTLARDCSLIDRYVTRIERYHDDGVTVSVSPAKCLEAVMHLLNVDYGG